MRRVLVMLGHFRFYFLSLMVFSRKWSGTKFGTIVKFTWTDQIQSRSWPWQLILQDVFMTILTDYYFYMFIGKHLLWINFVFFVLLVWDNLKVSVGLILAKAWVMRIPLDLSSRSFIALPCFIRSRRPIPLLAPFLRLSLQWYRKEPIVSHPL